VLFSDGLLPRKIDYYFELRTDYEYRPKSQHIQAAYVIAIHKKFHVKISMSEKWKVKSQK